MCFLYTHSALDRALRRNKLVFPLEQGTRLAIFSDLHRGVGDWADDFMHNALSFRTALDYYWKRGFSYVELGDGDELYENRHLSDIVRGHAEVFRIMDRFQRADRLFFIWGNHNRQMRRADWLEHELRGARTYIPGLFEGVEIYDSALLGDRIFFFHGHQGDPIHDLLAPMGRFFVRFFWRKSQNRFGFRDPTSPAQNTLKRSRVEKKILSWARSRRMTAVAGHTHRPVFESLSRTQRLKGMKGLPFYFNCGCGVHPRSVTGMEVEDMQIRLVKWHIIADPEDDGRLKVRREPIEGCRKSLDRVVRELGEQPD